MVTVITPVWGKSDLTHKFLFQNWNLYRFSPDVEFVIVNNASPDNTAVILDIWQRLMGDRLQVITNTENRGFGPANNQGAEIARGDSFIFLSNDVIISGDYVSRIEQGALSGPQVLDYDTGWNTFDGATIPYVAGWCVMATRKVWQDIGGWDERFVPCDYEDLDLSLAAVKKGYLLKQVDLPLTHLFGQSARALEGGRLEITLKNQALFKEKWGFNGIRLD